MRLVPADLITLVCNISFIGGGAHWIACCWFLVGNSY